MLLPIPKDVLQTQARQRAHDTLLGSLGVSAAVVSASFAAYMAVIGPSGRPVSDAAPYQAMAGLPTHAPRMTAAPPSEPDATASETGGIDFDPTGSIAPLPSQPRDASEPSPNPRIVLADFAVRDAFDGTALVEAHGNLRMVQPGGTIEGAGTVLSITKRGHGWVVATSGGLILQRR